MSARATLSIDPDLIAAVADRAEQQGLSTEEYVALTLRRALELSSDETTILVYDATEPGTPFVVDREDGESDERYEARSSAFRSLFPWQMKSGDYVRCNFPSGKSEDRDLPRISFWSWQLTALPTNASRWWPIRARRFRLKVRDDPSVYVSRRDTSYGPGSSKAVPCRREPAGSFANHLRIFPRLKKCRSHDLWSGSSHGR